MKQIPGLLLIVIFAFIAPSLFSQEDNSKWQGLWIRAQPDTVILEISFPVADSFEFKMTSFNPDFYGYIGGNDFASSKYAHIRGKHAYFNDTGAISDGRPLYYEGEEPCDIVFMPGRRSRLSVKEKNCWGIYGGSGVSWEGKYKKIKDPLRFCRSK